MFTHQSVQPLTLPLVGKYSRTILVLPNLSRYTILHYFLQCRRKFSDSACEHLFSEQRLNHGLLSSFIKDKMSNNRLLSLLLIVLSGILYILVFNSSLLFHS